MHSKPSPRRSSAGLIALFVFAIAALPPARAAEPLASVEADGGLTYHVMSLERKRSILTLKLAVHNVDKETRTFSIGVCGKDALSYLLDEESGTKYFALRDDRDKCLASESEYIRGAHGILEDIEPGATRRFWVKYPAPPPEVTSISVHLDWVEPLEELPIADR